MFSVGTEYLNICYLKFLLDNIKRTGRPDRWHVLLRVTPFLLIVM